VDAGKAGAPVTALSGAGADACSFPSPEWRLAACLRHCGSRCGAPEHDDLRLRNAGVVGDGREADPQIGILHSTQGFVITAASSKRCVGPSARSCRPQCRHCSGRGCSRNEPLHWLQPQRFNSRPSGSSTRAAAEENPTSGRATHQARPGCRAFPAATNRRIQEAISSPWATRMPALRGARHTAVGLMHDPDGIAIASQDGSVSSVLPSFTR